MIASGQAARVRIRHALPPLTGAGWAVAGSVEGVVVEAVTP